MHNDPGGLVDDEKVLILPDDRDVEILWLEWCGLEDLGCDLLSTLQAVAFWPPLTIDEGEARRDHPLGKCARLDLRTLCERPIEAGANERFRNVKAELCQRVGSSGRQR